ncbi:MAG: family 1 encapsulin nanocompartment shell protein [Halanaerobiaceae bacterium]
MTLFNRNLAPIDEQTWEFLNEEAQEYLPLQLTGRKLVDVTGPKGSETAALNTGRIEKIESSNDISLTRRLVQPLIEMRVPFTLSLSELENYSRGAEDVNVDSLQEAADKVAAIEDGAIISGLEEAGIKGIKEEAEHSLKLSDKPKAMFSVIIEGINTLFNAGVGGPFALVLDNDLFKKLYNLPDSGYPLTKRLEDINIKKVHTSPGLDKGGLLLSIRGGDFELALGEDLAIGFKGQKGDDLEFFFAESFTSRVISPEAAVALN